jgi:hypothetical protein
MSRLMIVCPAILAATLVNGCTGLTSRNTPSTSGFTQSTTTTITTSTTVTPAPNISVSITQPTYGFNVLPSSVRRVFATVTNSTTNALTWSVTGRASLSSTTGAWVDVIAPSSGSSCSIGGTPTNYYVTSSTTFSVTATSQDDNTRSATITVNVCNPAVQVSVVPFYTTLYAGQKADIQAIIWGSTNRNVTWAITSQPGGGDGSLTDTGNWDTAFSATVAGRYTLTSTSSADGTKSNTATVYVTGHTMPYQVTSGGTMPVDCTADPQMTGHVYDVGPSQATYHTIQSVPWPSLTAGSTVRVHNEDTSGSNPTTYHEYFQLKIQATRTQPIRVCGVPDANGNLPVIDASNGTGRSDVSQYSAGYAVAGLGATGWAGVYTGSYTGPQYLIFEGVKIQNAKPAYAYTTPSGQSGTAWVEGAACVRTFTSMDVVIRGVDAYNCDNGLMSDFNSNNGYAVVENTLYEGNHLHGSGENGAFLYHQFYIQGFNQIAQFNLFDHYTIGAQGSNLKSRGVVDIIRYNHFTDGPSRQIDMIDNQDATAYESFDGYLGAGTDSYHYLYPSDTYGADLLAAAVEAHHDDYVYGNTFVNSTAAVPIHYSTDHGSLESDRIGTLWFYNNSFYEPACNGCLNYRWYLFDTSGGGGNDFPEIEWPQIQIINDALWMDDPTKPIFNWDKEQNQFSVFATNAVNATYGTGSFLGGDGTGWASGTSSYAFQGASNSAGVTGVANLILVPSAPFNPTTFAPYSALLSTGADLPSGAAKMPVRFQFGPSATVAPRSQPLTIGAME